jgi:hypothetical protein
LKIKPALSRRFARSGRRKCVQVFALLKALRDSQ